MFGDVARVVAEAQGANLLVLTDLCKVTRADPDNPGGFDPVNGATPAGVIKVHKDLPCSIREPARESRESLAGEHLFQQGDSVLRLDVGYSGITYDDPDLVSGELHVGDTVEFTSTPQGVHLSHTFTVVWLISGSHMSSARFVVRKVL